MQSPSSIFRRALRRTSYVLVFALLVALAILFSAQDPSIALAQEAALVVQPIAPVQPHAYRGDVQRLPQVPQPQIEFREPLEPFAPKIALQPDDGGPVEPNNPTNRPQAAMPSPIQNFAGLSRTDLCGGVSCGGGTPPDTNGDVGPNHYILGVNTAYAIYSKTGALLASFTENQLFSGGPTGTICDTSSRGDPIVLYDQLSDRWILTNFAFTGGGTTPPFYQCFAVSMTGDPVSGGWWLYALRTDDASHAWLNDYPKFGIWPDCLYMTVNGFNSSLVAAGTEVWSLSRADMERGASLTGAVVYITGTSEFSRIPSNVLGNAPGAMPPAGTPNYIVSESMTIYGLDVRKFTAGTNCGGGGTISATTTVPHTSYNIPNATVEQPNTTTDLDDIGDRLMQKVQYRKVGSAESLWVTHTFKVAPGEASVTGSQWLQVDVTGGTINTTPVQQQKYDPADGLWRWMSSIAADNAGNAALGYSTSNNSTPNFPSIAYSGRLAGDPLNTLPQSETQLIAGNGSQNFSCGGACKRWGDYSSMSVDPTDDCTFWYTSEYYDTQTNGDSGNWHTRIGSFQFPQPANCTPSPVSTTNHSIIFDGGVGADWKQSTERLGTQNGFDFYSTWDASNLYVGIKGGAPGNFTYAVVVDTDASDTSASNTGSTSALSCAGGFNANGKGNFALVRAGATIGSFGSTSKQRASGGAWTSWAPSATTDALDYGRNMSEFRFSLADLGLSGTSNTIGLYIYRCASSAMASAWPPENLQTGTPVLLAETLIPTNSSGQTPRTYDAHWNQETVNADTTGLKSLLNGYVQFNVTTAGGASCTLTAFVNGNADQGVPQIIRRKYTITPTNCSGLVGNLTLKYEDGTIANNAPSEITGFDETTFEMVRYNGSIWVNVAADSRDTVNNTITKNGVTQFSPWSMGTGTPTAAELVSFNVRPTPKHRVRVKWTTGNESDIFGFNVWRAATKQGDYKKLNETLLPAKQAGILQGANYAFGDKSVKQGKTYFYKVEIVHADGSSTWSEAKRVIVK